MKNRRDKIRFLKGLATGHRSLAEIKPRRVILFIHHEGEIHYKEACPEQTLWTEQEIQEYQEKHPEDTISLIRICRT